jgi:uncharacterized protein YjbI with pentapeptide repeats
MSRTLYDLLEVSKTAPPEVIKSAYRALAALYHPDSGPNADEEKFKKIAKAYEILSNPEKRAEYDSRILHGEEDIFLGFANHDESKAPKTVKRLDGSDTWCTIDEHIRRRGMELSRAELKGLVLRELQLEGAQLDGADVSHCEFESLNLKGVNLSSAVCKQGKFKNVDFSGAIFEEAVFENCVFLECYFNESQISNTSFISSDFRGSRFQDVKFENCFISCCIFEGINFLISETSYATPNVFNNCKVYKSNMIKISCNIEFYHSNYIFFKFYKCDFKESNLSESKFKKVHFDVCNFKDCILSKSNFNFSSFTNTISFQNAILFETDLTDSRITKADFSTCNLVNTRFHNAKLKNVVFPKGYKIPESAIIKDSNVNKLKYNESNLSKTEKKSIRDEYVHSNRDVYKEIKKSDGTFWAWFFAILLTLTFFFIFNEKF